MLNGRLGTVGRSKIGTLVSKVCNQWAVLRIFAHNACLSDENGVFFRLGESSHRISWLVAMLQQFHLCLDLCHNVFLPSPLPTTLLLLRVCLQLKYFQSIREKKDVRFVMYILVPAAGLQPWTQCGDGGWLGRGAGVRGAFFFNLPCSILTKLIFFQIKHFFAQQITNTIQIKSRLRPHF